MLSLGKVVGSWAVFGGKTLKNALKKKELCLWFYYLFFGFDIIIFLVIFLFFKERKNLCVLLCSVLFMV